MIYRNLSTSLTTKNIIFRFVYLTTEFLINLLKSLIIFSAFALAVLRLANIGLQQNNSHEISVRHSLVKPFSVGIQMFYYYIAGNYSQLPRFLSIKPIAIKLEAYNREPSKLL